jgi:transcriptional regulator
MYSPNHFAETRTELLHHTLIENPLGTLVAVVNGAATADEIPFVLAPARGALGTLCGHVARANPLANLPSGQHQALVIFRGPQAYVSPSWYPGKAEHGKVVPTWNYVIVQARGQLRIIDNDPIWLRQQLEALTNAQEAPRAAPWQVSEAPADYLAQMMRAIVGIEITLDTLVGKWKVSQNRSEADRAGVIGGLTDAPGEQAAKMAQLVQKTLLI